ncbi:MAG: hypothetical protein ACTSRP_00910 [Candidatus Helarchaeota archaeon]
MNMWDLILENICGYRGINRFRLVEGLNWVIGKNASGKTSLVNGLKLLNKIKYDNLNQYLYSGAMIGTVELNNSSERYYSKIQRTIENNKLVIRKVKDDCKEFQSNYVDLSFSFIDNTNEFMKSVEYDGSLELIMNKLFELSSINYYEEMLFLFEKLKNDYEKEKEDQIKELVVEQKNIKSIINYKNKKLSKLKEELDQFQQQSDIFSGRKELERKRDEYKLKLDQLYNELNENLSNLELSESQLIKRRKQLEEINKFLETEHQIDNIKIFIKENELKIKSLRAEIKKINELIEENKIDIKIMKDHLRKLNSTIKHIETKGNEPVICEYCLSPVDYEKVKTKIQEIRLSIQKVENQNIGLQHEINEKTSLVHKINKLIEEKKSLPIRISETKGKKEALLKKIQVLEDKISKYKSRVDSLKSNIDNYSKILNDLEKEIIEKTSKNDEIKRKQTEILKEISILENDIHENEFKLTSISSILKNIPNKYSKIKKFLNLNINKIMEKINNFRQEFLDILNEELLELTTKLDWKFKKIIITDNLTLKVRNKDNHVLAFNTLSGFERKSIAILIMLAIKLRFFPQIPFFCIDEHLNAADNIRFINFIKFLYPIVENKLKFFIITSVRELPEIKSIGNIIKLS